MRIDLNPPDPQRVSTETTTAKKAPVAATNYVEHEPIGDQADRSQDKVTLSALATQALALPEVRQSLVESLRQSINSGEYKLDPSAIADAILNR